MSITGTHFWGPTESGKFPVVRGTTASQRTRYMYSDVILLIVRLLSFIFCDRWCHPFLEHLRIPVNVQDLMLLSSVFS